MLRVHTYHLIMYHLMMCVSIRARSAQRQTRTHTRVCLCVFTHVRACLLFVLHYFPHACAYIQHVHVGLLLHSNTQALEPTCVHLRSFRHIPVTTFCSDPPASPFLSSTMADKLERDLIEVLRDTSAPESLTVFLKKEKLTTCALFFDSVKTVDEVEAKICARLEPPATALRDVSSIRSAWRRTEVEAKRALSGEPLSPEDWEVPLATPTKNALTTKFAAAYGLVRRARKMPCDTLLGRVFREREKQSLTAYPLGKVRSLASTPQSKERHTLGFGIVLEHGVDKTVDMSMTPHGFLSCLTVLLNAYVLVGVDGWCSRQQAEDYMDMVEQKLWRPRSPGLAFIADVELQHRLRWLDLVRGPDGLDLGKAIERASSELAGLWQFGVDTSIPSASQAMSSGGLAERPSKRPRLKQFVIADKKGDKEFCKLWNSGKCQDGDACPNGRMHVCNVKGCGKKHRRCNNHLSPP